MDEIRVSHPAFPSEPINVDNLHSTNEIFMKRAFKYYVTFLAEREGVGGGVRAFISLLHDYHVIHGRVEGGGLQERYLLCGSFPIKIKSFLNSTNR